MTTVPARSETSTASKPVLPPMPRRPEDTGLSSSFLVELITKTLFLRGLMRLPELAAQLKLSPGVLEPLLAFMRSERLCEVARRGESEAALSYQLTDLGRARAQDYIARSRYIGPAPVTLTDYVAQIQRQSVRQMRVTREQIAQAFHGIVVKEHILQQFGAAMNSGRAIFVYGPPGSGKTYLTQQLVELLSGEVAIPYAITVDDEVIQIFDPFVHRPAGRDDHGGSIFQLASNEDPRWVLCKRPVVHTGAELTLASVDLEYGEQSGFYHAPPQVKANNGLFIIDDLGRQLVPAHDLMNRWIVPLDRQVDYLTLHTGKRFMVPFDVIVVFSSNLRPSEMADDALLRRLGYKIHIDALDEHEYRSIFEQVCQELSIPFTDAGFGYLINKLHNEENRPLLACVPRDILTQIRDITHFRGVKTELTEELLDWAWNNYHAKH